MRSAPGTRDLRTALTSRISDIAGAQVLGRDGIQAQQAAKQQLNAGIQYLAMGLIIAFTIIAGEASARSALRRPAATVG